MQANTFCKVRDLQAARFPDKQKECADSSVASKTAWIRGLNRGCLQKSINEKLHLYSHLKALSCRKLSKPFTIDSKSSLTYCSTHNAMSSKTSNAYSYARNDETKPDSMLPLSPVLHEDFSKPPEDYVESDAKLFTVQEFFDYLWSDKWGDDISLRVVGGNLLEILLASLHELEMKQQLSSHVVRANLNNRQEAKVLEQEQTSVLQIMSQPVAVEEAARNVKKSGKRSMARNSLINTSSNARKNASELLSFSHVEDLPGRIGGIVTASPMKPVDVSNQWNYETMVVQLVFYEKSEASNISYITPDKAKEASQSGLLVPILREAARPPWSYVKYKMNHVRLPIGEDLDVPRQIVTLRCELAALSANQEQPANDEWNKEISKYENKERNKSVPQPPSGVKKSVDDTEWITEDLNFRSDRLRKNLDQQIKQPLHIRQDSKIHIWSYSDKLFDSEKNLSTNDDDIKIFVYKTLNLTNNELYVNGLYLPRNENMVPVAEKLRRALHTRQKLSSGKVNSYLDKRGEYKSHSTQRHGKYLSGFTEKVRQKKISPPQKSREGQKEQIKNVDTCGRLWNQYRMEQEAIEMESALNSKIKIDIYKPISGTSAAPAPLTSSIKAKETGKQKTMNQEAADNPLKIENRNNNIAASKRRDRKNDILLPKLANVSSNKEQVSLTKLINTKTSGNVNANSSIESARRKQQSESYFYVPEFERTIVRSSASLSEYQRLRNHRITAHTPYLNMSCVPDEMHSRHNEIPQDFTGHSSINEDSDNYKTSDNKSELRQIFHGDSQLPHAKLMIPSKDFASYSCECNCTECTYQIEALDDLRPNMVLSHDGCPLRLGRLRRDIRVPKINPALTVMSREVISQFPIKNTLCVYDQLMKLIDHMMIRKEILSSSLGHTSITVTFTKRKHSGFPQRGATSLPQNHPYQSTDKMSI